MHRPNLQYLFFNLHALKLWKYVRSSLFPLWKPCTRSQFTPFYLLLAALDISYGCNTWSRRHWRLKESLVTTSTNLPCLINTYTFILVFLSNCDINTKYCSLHISASMKSFKILKMEEFSWRSRSIDLQHYHLLLKKNDSMLLVASWRIFSNKLSNSRHFRLYCT